MRRVVITGFGVVTPIGSNRLAFFEGLANATSGVAKISAFDASTFATRFAGEVLDRQHCEFGADLSDHLAALRRDPKSRFAVRAGLEALQHAFGDAEPFASCTPSRRGAYIAAGLEIFNLEDLAPFVDASGVAGAALAAAVAAQPEGAYLQIPADLGARCLAQLAEVGGPLSVNVSACAAGTQAVGEAFRAIADGVVDGALTGGYDSMVNPLGVGGFCLLGALSTDNEACGAASRPFDIRRDGFVLGEGAAIFVLEELSLAQARGATIHAELLGYGSTLDAYRITDPDISCRGAMGSMTAALGDAGLETTQIDAISAHGTGTPKGDVAETRAVKAVFGDQAPRIPISATKSQTGHLIGAAGAVELAACLWSLQHQRVPATINLERPDPECDLDYVAKEPRPTQVERLLSNSFGFGGQNASIILGALR